MLRNMRVILFIIQYNILTFRVSAAAERASVARRSRPKPILIIFLAEASSPSVLLNR